LAEILLGPTDILTLLNISVAALSLITDFVKAVQGRTLVPTMGTSTDPE